MSYAYKCKHKMIDVESTGVDFFASCVFCKQDVSEEVSQPGMVYSYDEYFRYWVRKLGGYGVRVT